MGQRLLLCLWTCCCRSGEYGHQSGDEGDEENDNESEVLMRRVVKNVIKTVITKMALRSLMTASPATFGDKLTDWAWEADLQTSCSAADLARL